MVWWTVRLGSGAASWCYLDLVNLAFHEFGHLVFTPFGSTLHYLGGSLGQLAVPGLLIFYFILRRDDPPAAAFCLWWLGENLVNISVYMADARDLHLPLVGGGDHDWNELFYRFGLLGEVAVGRVSSATHLVGTLVMVVGLLWFAYFVLPSRARSAVNTVITSRSPALERLFPISDAAD
jgi:hypothetical protein